MKKRLVVFLTFLGIAFSACSINDLYQQEDFATVDSYLVCPSDPTKCLTLVPINDDTKDCIYVSICTNDDEHIEEYKTNETFRLRDTVLVTWADKDVQFWVYDSDEGTKYWTYTQGRWTCNDYRGDEPKFGI